MPIPDTRYAMAGDAAVGYQVRWSLISEARTQCRAQLGGRQAPGRSVVDDLLQVRRPDPAELERADRGENPAPHQPLVLLPCGSRRIPRTAD
jgi:hypothetical protein